MSELRIVNETCIGVNNIHWTNINPIIVREIKKLLEEKEELHLNRIDELTDRMVKLETNIDEAIELLSKGITFCENDSQGNYDICNIAINREKKAIEILKRDETNE